MRTPAFPPRLLLALAIVTEVLGTLCLRASDGFTRRVPSLGLLLFYAVSLPLFALAISGGLGLGVAYGMLTGTGLTAAALLSVVLFDESLTAVQVLGLAVIALGVIALTRRRGPVLP